MIVRRSRPSGTTPPHGWVSLRPGRLRRLRGLASVLLVLPLLLGLIGSPANAPIVRGDELSDAKAQQNALKKEVAEQKAAVAQLRNLQSGLAQEIAATKVQLNGINADLAKVKVRITKMQTRIDAVRAAYKALVAKLGALDNRLVAITASEERKREQLRERRDQLAERVRAAYDTDRSSLLEAFLSGGTFTDLLAEMSYVIDVGEQDKALAKQIASDQLILAALHQAVTDTRTQTEALRVETAAQKKALDASLKELKAAKAHLAKLEKQVKRELARQKAVYAQVMRNKANAAKALAAAAAAERQLTSKIKQLIRQQANRGNIPSVYNGTLIWPMAGDVTQNFGCTGFEWEPPQGSCAHYHSGIDIAAPMYTPVRASGEGTVVFAGPNPYDAYPKAWIVIIAHSTNLITWYAHLDNGSHPIKVSAGQHVNQGQVIAYNGMTGRTTGPHLHWMVELNGSFVNPRLFL